MAQATEARQVRQEQFRDGARDFDFLKGRYRVHNVRFAGRLEQSERWETFDALSVAAPLPRGIGQIDEMVADGRSGYVGITLRLYDQRTRRWSLYRVDGSSGMLQPPLQGAFNNGVGIFEGHDELGRQPVRTRLTWSQIDAVSARCEQAWSRDNGATWESNWIMQYARLEERPGHGMQDQGLALATMLMFGDPQQGQRSTP